MDNMILAQSNELIQGTGPIDAILFERWINFIDATPKTLETYKKCIKQFVLFLQANGITKPTRETIIAYRDSLLESKKPTTVQSYLNAVKLFFQWTELEGIYPNVANHIKGAKLDNTHKKDYLTSNQVQRVLGAIDTSTLTGKRDYSLICLMVTTGLRTISIERADIEDIRTVGDGVGLYYQGKGHQEKAEYVKLESHVENAIRDYLKERKALNGPLFGAVSNRNADGRLTTRSIRRIIKQRFQDVGLDSDRLTAHSLRHTAATLNLLNGGTVEETQQLLGHKNINTTLIYSHALDRAKNPSEKRIADAIFKD